MSRFIFIYLTLKKNIKKRFLTEHIPDVRFIYHKRNPLIMTVVKAFFNFLAFLKKMFKTILLFI